MFIEENGGGVGGAAQEEGEAVSTHRHLGMALQRALDAAMLAALIFLAIYTSSTLERLAATFAAVLLLLGWFVAWYRQRRE